MGREVAILIPTYKRAHKIKQVLQNIHQNTRVTYNAYFILDRSDPESIYTCNELGYNYIIHTQRSYYAAAINLGYLMTWEPYFFVGADDLNFHPDWDTEALKKMDEGYDVVGTNDQLNRDVLAGKSATHFLVRRKYIQEQGGTIDKSYPVLYEYFHNYPDTEFIATAKKRGVFAPCLTSVVEHLHPSAKKAKVDATYVQNQSTLEMDRRTYEQRRHLWEGVN